jgi:CubicO group peptidase (beta-lactamase class C family)
MAQWTEMEPEAAGFSPAMGRKLDAGVDAGLLPKLHTVAVSRHGKLVFERYFAGHDEKILQDLGHVEFGPETLHDCRSVTKSVVGLLYGIALGRGLVPAPEASLFAQFPEYADLGADPERRKRTMAHALTMTLGMEWDESKPYTSTENSEIAMEVAPDRYRFVLERPIVGEPGEAWIYSGGAVALLGGIIERGTGKRLAAFAEEALFEPLGIASYEWFAGEDGAYSAAAGLRLSTRSLLKIGVLAIEGGQHASKQIVPRDWIETSWQKRYPVFNGAESYGYLWYISSAPMAGAPHRQVGGYGNGGQRLFLIPDLNIACVVFCGDYNGGEQGVTPNRVWREIVLAGLKQA